MLMRHLRHPGGLLAALLVVSTPGAPTGPIGIGQAVAGEPAAAEAPQRKQEQSFEDLLRDALPANDLPTLLEPLYARCDSTEDLDDLPRRQCEGIREALLARLRTHTFAAESDSPLDISPYDAGAKEIDMDVSGCVACVSPPLIAGQVRFVSTRPPQRVVAGKPVFGVLASHQLTMDSKIAADRFFEHVLPRLRVQHVFRVGAVYGEGGGKGQPKGISIVSLGHRVYDHCTGKVLASTPPSTERIAVTADKTCSDKGDEELSRAELLQQAQTAALPTQLTFGQIEQALSPVQAKVHECYVEFNEVTGTAKVALSVGGDGKLTKITLAPPFDKADIGVCIKAQLRTAVFPHFHGEPMRVDYTFQVN